MKLPETHNDDHKFPDFNVSQNDSDSLSINENKFSNSDANNLYNSYFFNRNLQTSTTENRNMFLPIQNNYEYDSNNNEADEIYFYPINQDNNGNEFNNIIIINEEDNNNINNNNDNNNINNNEILETQTVKIFHIKKIPHNKKGRKGKNSFRKTKSDRNREDDILNKIEVIAINDSKIIINIEINNYYKEKKNDYLLRKIKPLFQNANVKTKKEYLNKTIKDIFSSEISKRFKDSKKNINYNKKRIDKIIKENKSKKLIEIFNETFESFYEKYINNIYPVCQLKDEIEKYKNEDISYGQKFEDSAKNFIDIIKGKKSRIK